MASSRDRQRKLAREKLDRQLARRAAALRRRRRIQAGVGAALALVLIAAGSAWALGAFDADPETNAAPEICTWTPQNPANNANLREVGTPSTTDVPTEGTRPMTLTTNQGAPITVALDLVNAPCGAASIAHLAGQGFFDNTQCHEITTEGALLCGDPTGTGSGGPAYTFFNQNVPPVSATPDGPPLYPAGTVAFLGVPPGANGSQFLIFFKDYTTTEPMYPVVGRVTAGQDVVDTIGKMETVDNGSGAKVKPATEVLIQSLTVGEVTTSAPAPDLTEQPPAASPSPAGQS